MCWRYADYKHDDELVSVAGCLGYDVLALTYDPEHLPAEFQLLVV